MMVLAFDTTDSGKGAYCNGCVYCCPCVIIQVSIFCVAKACSFVLLLMLWSWKAKIHVKPLIGYPSFALVFVIDARVSVGMVVLAAFDTASMDGLM